jgi:DNA polymerase III subunit delta'
MTTSQPYWPIFGHTWAIEQLDRSIANGRVGHAYMFSGPSAIGKTRLALAMAMRLNCQRSNKPCGECRACRKIEQQSHPDLLIIEADRVGGTLKIDQIREIQRSLSLRPYEAAYKIAIFRRFHEANAATQNALLKTLEEPAAQVILILTVEQPDQILPTIFSRCQVFNLRPLSLATVYDALQTMRHDKSDTDLELITQLSGGRLGWAVQAIVEPEALALRNEALELLMDILERKRLAERLSAAESLAKDKGHAVSLLEYWLTFWRDLMLIATGSQTRIINIDYEQQLQQLASFTEYGSAHHALEATREALQQLTRNANARLCLEVMLMRYP